MNLICDKVINCPGSDFPILNVSSEGTDTLVFAGIIPFKNPPPNCLSCPPVGTFSAVDCHGVVYSAMSQIEADLLALAASVNCNPGPDGTCFNQQQSASYTCLDGTVFTAVVPAGSFSAVSHGDAVACQEAANAQALAFAQQQLSQMATNCPVIPPPFTCAITSTSPLPDGTIGSGYSKQLVGTTNLPVNTFSLSSGALPPGLVLLPGGLIQGTPTAAGTYNFTVRLEGT